MFGVKKKTGTAEGEQANGSVIALADWWRSTVAMERELDYRASTPFAQAAWDDLVGRLMLSPSPVLYLELMECARLWRARRISVPHPTLLDALVATACDAGMWLSEGANDAATRLRRRLLDADCGDEISDHALRVPDACQCHPGPESR